MTKGDNATTDEKPLPFWRRWAKYILAGGFLFFLLKGIGWLVLLGLAVWQFTG